MAESDMQVDISKYNSKFVEKYFDLSGEKTKTLLERIKKLKEKLNFDDRLENLPFYYKVFHNFCSEFLDFECLEAFINCIIEKARKAISQNVFNINYFLCGLCGEIMREPITLKCGHTFSKKCILAGVQSGSFECVKCGKRYSHSYLSQLKTTVLISALIEKFWTYTPSNPRSARKYNFQENSDLSKISPAYKEKFLRNLEACYEADSADNHFPKGLLTKGDILFHAGKYKEAILVYLVGYTFDSSAVLAKNQAIELLHKLLLKCPTIEANNDHSPTLRSCLGQKENADANNCTYNENWNSVRVVDTKEKQELSFLIKSYCFVIVKLGGEKFVKNRIQTPVFDKRDFECPLCIRMLWEPITTPCGHTFCRPCLYRCFDHQPACPLCKANLTSCLAERVRSTTEFIEVASKSLTPDDYAEREALYYAEMEEFYNAGKDPDHVVPLFICTIAFPSVPCPLHIFEPRYRLMIRQCMESGSRKFGMCASIDDNISDFGTMLEIKDVRYFPDGRCVVDTVGSRRFHILKKGERDGYNTGSVEYLQDNVLSNDELQDLKRLHDDVYRIAHGWFTGLPADTKHRILQHFGPMPEVESDYTSMPDGPSWCWWLINTMPLEPRSQVFILSMTCLSRRLQTLQRVLVRLDSSTVS